MQVLSMGPTAVLVEEPPVHPAEFAVAIREHHPGSVIDVVPGASTVLITAASPDRLARVVSGLDQLNRRGAASAEPAALVEIPVRYDGPDLDEVAAATGLTVEQVIDLHRTATYRVDFCGFAPGFGYLSGLPEQLWLPRRPTPRTRVPAGAVAIASEYTAVYPSVSPGGWHLIGTTDATLFDISLTPPALLTPGATVRFVREVPG